MLSKNKKDMEILKYRRHQWKCSCTTFSAGRPLNRQTTNKIFQYISGT